MSELPAAPPPARPWLAVESFLATALAAWLAIRLGHPVAWLVVPLALLFLLRRNPDHYGLEPRFTPPSLHDHLVIGLGAFAIYGIAHVAIAWLVRGQTFVPRLPDGFAGLVLHHLVVIAFPEELFFRGYLQSNLDRVFGKGWRLRGARVGPAFVLQAVLFALCHLAGGDWTRLQVFFFALLAGWLRARSGSILAPVAYHAVANLWYAALVVSLR